jgi:1,4-dihydroxy-2-naphthoate octaprenyltransferase
MSPTFAAGFWRLADPKITLASAASLLVGLSAAAQAGAIHWGWLLVTVFGIFAIETAKNASGEVFDWDSGTDRNIAQEDRSPFSGGKRVLVDGLLTRKETWFIAATAYVIGIGAGLSIVWLREPSVVWFGLAGVALAWFYHAPPLKLSYRGLGELAVGIAYGPIISCGAYLVQRGEVAHSVVLVSVPLGLLIAAFLWVNEFPDERADRPAGKRTLVVRLGRRRAGQMFLVIVIAAFVWQLSLPFAGLSAMLLLGLIAWIFAFRAAMRLKTQSANTAEIIPAQGWTLLSFVLLAVLDAVALLLS